MRIDYFCFIFAALCGIAGMCLGIWMGVSGDHSLAPTHAHLNLIGWVTMTLFGLYHRGLRRQTTLLDKVQVGCGAIGVPAFTGGLAIYLTTTSDTVEAVVFPIGLAGTLLCLGSMVLFLAILIRDARQPTVSARIVGALQ